MSKPAVRSCRPSQQSDSVTRASHPSHRRSPSSDLATRINHPSLSSKWVFWVSRQSQPSGSAVRVHRQCLPSESAGRTSHPEQLTTVTCSPTRGSTSDEKAEQSPQHTRGTMYTMPVPLPVIRPVDPRQLQPRKRLWTVSASHPFDTSDPLQEPPRKRRSALQSPANDPWTGSLMHGVTRQQTIYEPSGET